MTDKLSSMIALVQKHKDNLPATYTEKKKRDTDDKVNGDVPAPVPRHDQFDDVDEVNEYPNEEESFREEEETSLVVEEGQLIQRSSPSDQKSTTTACAIDENSESMTNSQLEFVENADDPLSNEKAEGSTTEEKGQGWY